MVTSSHVDIDRCRLNYTGKAVDSARSARKKRIICFIIFLVILIIVAIVVAVVVKQQVDANK